ncbi:hypothetical protein CLV28_1765 [Sediminihabitans luteus]|uniref:Uncharacterized protein n=1 Tax=Sediminihabitans luteus TaxID=1138585 RepID=A0A2M9CR04_9CELL|nr:hypothetical protein [Sediminihabitans luteus]PJJ74271.1 hypothetical protein CLV28_1765 [Sediminihabitans luteus]GII99124.1 hypothetical protein Slu03_15020 [Sediminihabitans luteus]
MSTVRTALARAVRRPTADAVVDENLPEVGLTVDATIHGAVLRMALAGSLVVLLTLAFFRVEGGGDKFTVETVGLGTATGIAVLVALVAVYYRGLPFTQLAVAAAAIGFLASIDGPFDPVVLAALPFAHLALRADAWCTAVPWSARVETAALRDDVRSSLVVQCGTQLLGVTALLVSGYQNVWLLGVAALALGALTYLVIPRAWWS